jgi:hypothetical protein
VVNTVAYLHLDTNFKAVPAQTPDPTLIHMYIARQNFENEQKLTQAVKT